MPRPLSDDARLTSDVSLSVAYIGPKSKTERPRNTKIDTEVAHVTRDSDTTFKVKRSKVKVTGAGAYCSCLPHSLFILYFSSYISILLHIILLQIKWPRSQRAKSNAPITTNVRGSWEIRAQCEPLKIFELLLLNAEAVGWTHFYPAKVRWSRDCVSRCPPWSLAVS